MKTRQMNNIFIIAPLLILLLLLHATAVKAQEVEDEREFDYGKWSEKGPDRWGELREEWAACKYGKMQSPIDLSNQKVEIIPNSGDLKTDYKPSNATIKNRGHDISLQWTGNAGSIEIEGTDYPLIQAHWHSPSEHSINGKRYALELHMVHSNAELNLIAVIGVLYKFGKPDPFLSKLTRYIKHMVDQKEEESNPGVVDPNEVDIGSRSFYRYMGSLTTPPCTEGVTWTVKKKIRTVSKDQVNLLQEAVHDNFRKNARPRQPLNGRDVYLYVPKEKSDYEYNIENKQQSGTRLAFD